MKSFIVKKNEEGQSSLKYIQRTLANAPNSFIFKMLRKKNIVLNGKKIEGNEKVKEGDEIKFFLSDETFSSFSNKDTVRISTAEYLDAYARFKSPSVIFEDDHVLIVNKPVNMLSQKAAKDDLSANEWLIGYLLNEKKLTKESLLSFTPSVCNRLDRNTGGLLLFGKTLFGVNTLNELLRNRTLDKYYLTAVKGKVNKEMKISGYLLKDEKNNKVSISKDKSSDEASYIETAYNPVEYISDIDVTILKVLLITGKPHQIRAHLSYIGHPIIGDMKYGNADTNEEFKKKCKITHQILFCVSVTFPELDNYPALSGKTISIEEPAVFSALRSM